MARLTVSAEAIELRAGLLRHYVFVPESVIEIRRYSFLPVVGWGIRIHHSIAECPARVIFWCFGNPDKLLERVRETGFQPRGARLPAPVRQAGFPIRWQAIVTGVAVWDGLFLLDRIAPDRHAAVQPAFFAAPFTMLALLLLFAVSAALPRLPALQQFLLKEGRTMEEIRTLRIVLMAVPAGLLAVFAALGLFAR
jgi:hypothetical protein